MKWSFGEGGMLSTAIGDASPPTVDESSLLSDRYWAAERWEPAKSKTMPWPLLRNPTET